MLRRSLFFTLSLVLLFALPLEASGQQKGTVPSASQKAFTSNLKTSSKPLKDQSAKDSDYRIPSDYPLVSEGEFAGALVDSVSTTHYLFYQSTKSYSADKMNLQVYYESDSPWKDPYLNLEFFTNNNGSMKYLGVTRFNVDSVQKSTLSNILSKSLYANDPYIYVRAGVLANPSDAYYTAVTDFKVKNPFYISPASTSYELISNQSADGGTTESSGSFSIQNKQYALNKTLTKGAYKLDYVKPFNVSKYKNKVVHRNASILPFAAQVGDSHSFWVSNLVTNEDYQISAKLLYSGKHADVWVNNNQITATNAKKLGEEFDNKIHPLDVANFGNESDVDKNGKVNILCYDIQDGFSGSGGFVAGYFNPADLYAAPHSNYSEIFYIDTNPLMGTGTTKDVTPAYSTLAHEFQHMINFNQNVLVEGHDEMDTWMNEGMSMAAEKIYEGKPLQDRIDYYNEDPSISNGQSLLYWDYNGDVLANYSLAYLFFQYLEIQCNAGESIFKEIINDPNSDYHAIQDVIRKHINSSMTFGQFMTDFRAALLLKDSTGLYGFKGQQAYNSLDPHVYYGSSVDLRGGGSLVKQIQSKSDFQVPGDKGGDVTYTFLSQKDKTPPAAPSVNAVSDKDTSVAGVTEGKALVTVKRGSTLLGKGYADTSGRFKVAIKKQTAGAALTVYAEDAAGNKSRKVIVTVLDKTPPATPSVHTITSYSTRVTGTAEKGATVYLYVGKKALAKGAVNSKGTFSIAIKKQKKGTSIIVYAKDKAGNTSKSITVKVK